VGILVQLTEAT